MVRKIKFLNSIIIVLLSQNGYSQLCKVDDHSPSIDIHTYVNGLLIDGEYAIWYKCLPGNDPALPNVYNIDDKLTKAFIICEGVDLKGHIDLEGGYRHIDGGFFRQPNDESEDRSNDFLPEQNMLTELRKRGYDVICLNLKQNMSSILYNSMLFRELILAVQAQLNANGSKHQITAGGWSMGGLVARTSLVQMEDDGIDTRVDKFITFDSPHRGANIPLALTSMVDRLVLLDDEMSFLTDFGLSPLRIFNENIQDDFGFLQPKIAGLQMAANLHAQNVERKKFVDYLNGRYPSNCRKIAVSSGTSNVHTGIDGDMLFSIGGQNGGCILDVTVGLPLDLGDVEVEFCPIPIQLEINSSPGNIYRNVFGLGFVLQLFPMVVVHNPFPPLASYKSYIHDYLTNPANLNLNLDHTPGSTYPLFQTPAHFINTSITHIPAEWHDTECLNIPNAGDGCVTVGFNEILDVGVHSIIGNASSECDYTFTFMPTVSALDIQGDNFNLDVKQIPTYPYVHDYFTTPFDAINVSTSNLRHVDLSQDVRAFIVEELAPINLYIQNRTFPNGYINAYEAHRIVIAKDSDTVANRSLVGYVNFENGSDVTFTVPPDGEIIIKDGVWNYGSNAHLKYDGVLPFNTPIVSPSSPFLRSSGNSEPIALNTSRVTTPEVNVTTKMSIKGMGKNTSFTDALTAVYNLSVAAYPNPTKANWNVNVTVPGFDNLNIAVYGMNGTLVYEQKGIAITEAGTYNCTINTDNLTRGIYLLKVSGDHQTVNTKLELVY